MSSATSAIASLIGGAAQTGLGINVQATVAQIIQADSGPLQQAQGQQATLNVATSVLNSISGNLTTLQTNVNSLNDVLGALNTRLATSSAPTIFSASADPTAVSGTHLVQVTSLATTSSYYSDAQSSATSALPTGQFTLQVGSGPATTVNVDSTNNTLSGLASTINGLNLGLTASVISDSSGSRLALVSSTSGSQGNISISNNTTGLNFNLATQGQDALLTVDGVPISSSTNTVTGAIQGVTLTLNSASPGSTQTLTVAPDTGSVTTAINNFVNAYNTVITSINQQFQVDANGNGGTLTGDSSLRTLQSSLLNDVNYALTGNNGIVNLSSLGVNLQNDGTLSVDNSTLSSALSNNFSNVQSFFQTTGSVTGFAANFSTSLLALTDATTGPISVDLSGINAEQTDLTNQINAFQAQLTTEQANLTTQYSQINAQLQALPQLEQQTASELASA